MQVQALMFDKTLWTVSEARRWLRDHGYRSSKVDEGGPKARFFHFRQAEPENFEFIRVGRLDGAELGIKAKYGCPL
jgi:hypothetical protein